MRPSCPDPVLVDGAGSAGRGTRVDVAGCWSARVNLVGHCGRQGAAEPKALAGHPKPGSPGASVETTAGPSAGTDDGGSERAGLVSAAGGWALGGWVLGGWVLGS